MGGRQFGVFVLLTVAFNIHKKSLQDYEKC
jgi:hypothetical protein